MHDDLGIVYLIDNAQQFWSGELPACHVLTSAALSDLCPIRVLGFMVAFRA